MTIEFQILVWSTILGLVQIILAAHFASHQYGYRWAASSRDQIMPPLQGVAGRLNRALYNFLETFPFFVTAVLVAHLADRHSEMTEWGSRLYFWGRLIYLPLYALGIPVVRSLIWNVATAGILLLLIALI